MEKVVERFLRYAVVDTQSDESSKSCPSTAKQLDLAKILAKELKEIGLTEVEIDVNGYVMGTLPATKKDAPTIGFIAHMDTSPDFTGTRVKPQIIENYNGKDIILNDREQIILSPKDFPELIKYVGQDLITTDGTTLLGADDKAGIAEIITAMEYLVEHPEMKHGPIKVAFTPDEEIGRGADHFDVEKFGADFAFTIDGGEIGELEYENFNAAMATVTVHGRNVHPGTAKNKMINSMHLAQELIALIPAWQRPEHTEKYEGFYHLIDFHGTVENTILRFIIRDHDMELFKSRKHLMEKCADYINTKYDGRYVKLEMKDQYYNMKEKIEPVGHVIDLAKCAMEKAGIPPIVKPIRGGTDGARLSFMGLPTPNLFTGGHNFHGKYEFIPIQSMVKAVEVIIKTATRAAENI
jgi:tripeptide aminopeptidase